MRIAGQLAVGCLREVGVRTIQRGTARGYSAVSMSRDGVCEAVPSPGDRRHRLLPDAGDCDETLVDGRQRFTEAARALEQRSP